MHWAKRHRLLQEWIDEVWVALLNLSISKRNFRMKKVIFKKARVRIKYYFKDRRRRDKDNYAPKRILDALRYNGILEDDSVDLIDVDWEILQGKPERTEIIIEEVN